jgi:hypothetical protein
LTRNGEPAREPGRQKRRRLPPLLLGRALSLTHTGSIQLAALLDRSAVCDDGHQPVSAMWCPDDLRRAPGGHGPVPVRSGAARPAGGLGVSFSVGRNKRAARMGCVLRGPNRFGENKGPFLPPCSISLCYVKVRPCIPKLFSFFLFWKNVFIDSLENHF